MSATAFSFSATNIISFSKLKNKAFVKINKTFFVTTKALYWKTIGVKAPTMLLLQDITQFSLEDKKYIAIETTDLDDEYLMYISWHENIQYLINFLNVLLPLLRYVEPEPEILENWYCSACKAVNEGTNKHCEWCRTPKFLG